MTESENNALHSPACGCTDTTKQEFDQYISVATLNDGLDVLTGIPVTRAGPSWCLNVAEYLRPKTDVCCTCYSQFCDSLQTNNGKTEKRIIRFDNYEEFFSQVDKWPELYNYLKDQCPDPERCDYPDISGETIPDYFRYIIFPYIRSVETNGAYDRNREYYPSKMKFKSALDFVASKNFNCNRWFSGALADDDEEIHIVRNLIRVSANDLTITFPDVFIVKFQNPPTHSMTKIFRKNYQKFIN